MASSAEGLFYIGETWRIVGDVRDVNDEVLDLTGATVEFRMSSRGADYDFSPTISDAENGVWQLIVTPAQQTAANIVPDEYSFEVRVTWPSGLVSTQVIGNINIAHSLFYGGGS